MKKYKVRRKKESRHEAKKFISFSEAHPDHLGYYTRRMEPATNIPVGLHLTVTVDAASPIFSEGVPRDKISNNPEWSLFPRAAH